MDYSLEILERLFGRNGIELSLKSVGGKYAKKRVSLNKKRNLWEWRAYLGKGRKT